MTDRDKSFWEELNQLAKTNTIILDRPKGKSHPRYPEMIYPFDYGYLEGTTAGDGDGIDVWFGSLESKTLTGILCTFDKIKRDAEIKLLINCTNDDIQIIREFHGEMRTLFIPNPLADL